MGDFLISAGKLFHVLTTQELNARLLLSDIGVGDGSAKSDMSQSEELGLAC